MSNLPKTSEITAGLGKARKTWIQEGAVGKSSHQNNLDLTDHPFFLPSSYLFLLAQPRKQVRSSKNQDPDLIYSPLYLLHQKKYYPNINQYYILRLLHFPSPQIRQWDSPNNSSLILLGFLLSPTPLYTLLHLANVAIIPRKQNSAELIHQCLISIYSLFP